MAEAGAVSWSAASKVAKRVASKEPFSNSYLAQSMGRQFAELTAEAETLVALETSLPLLKGAGRSQVVSRPEWAEVNIAAMQRLLKSPLANMESKSGNGVATHLGRLFTGAEIGALLGWMSSRVLGQYDQLLLQKEFPERQDIIYYVAPNVLALEKRYGFAPEEFRLWLALHECTHRAQFTGVPWLTEYFKAQVEVLLSAPDVDPQRIVTGIRSALARGDHSPDDDAPAGGLISAVAGPEQRQALDNVMGLMALLEGHGEVVMGRAGQARIPGAERFHRVINERRNAARGLARIVQRALGMDAKLRQYAQGAAFIAAVELAGGRNLFDRVWSGSDALPSYKEIAQPGLWIDRMRSDTVIPATS